MGRPGAGSSGSSHSSSSGGHQTRATGGGHQVRPSASVHRASSSSRPGAGSSHTSPASHSALGSQRVSSGLRPNTASHHTGSHFSGSHHAGSNHNRYDDYGNRGSYHGGPGYPPPPPPPPPRSGYDNYTGTTGAYSSGRSRRRESNAAEGRTGLGCFAPILVIGVIFGVLLLLGLVGTKLSGWSSTETIRKDPLVTSYSYVDDCIIDELGWFDSVQQTERSLKQFYDETGVQPYIILKAYDPALVSTGDKEQWAVDYYESNFEADNIFLYVYFADEDTDNVVGYMSYASGAAAKTIMNEEAVSVFWNNIDKYWYEDISMDDVMVSVFEDTADEIMTETVTSGISGEQVKEGFTKAAKVGKVILIVAVIVGTLFIAGVIVIIVISLKANSDREKEKAQQKILETPLEDMIQDELEKKYLDQDD